MSDLWINNVRLGSRPEPVSIVIRDGRITSIGDPPTDWSGPTLDGRGHLALPGLVDGHAHLDKTLWGLPWRPHSAGPGLAGLVENERTNRTSLPPVRERVSSLLQTYVDNGTVLIRSHVDVDPDNGLSAVEGVLEAAASLDGLIEVEVVAFPQSGMLSRPGTAELMEAAVRNGASLVGGIDPAGFDGDAVTHLDTIFGIAERNDCGIDLHLHDRGSLGRWEVGLVVERTRALGMEGRVTISHAFCLCDGDPSIDALLEQIADCGISLATVAPGSVDPLPLDRILELGIDICLGQDGIRDLWSPWGEADMLGRAGQMAWRAGYRRDEDIERCVELATWRGAKALGREDLHLEPGGRGDVVLVDAATPAAAAVTKPPRSAVVRGGAIVRSQ